MVGERHLHRVVQPLVGTWRAARLGADDIGAGLDHAFREQEPDREVEIVAGRAHRDRQGLFDTLIARPVVEANLERFLHRDEIGFGVGERPAVPVETNAYAYALRGRGEGGDVGAGRTDARGRVRAGLGGHPAGSASACTRARWSKRSCHSERWLAGRTSTAVTLYSGQLVAQSDSSVVTTLVPVSGWWKVV